MLAHQMAMESPWVQAEAIDAMEFPDLSDQHNVSGVPHTSVNAGAGAIIGAYPEPQMIQSIEQIISRAVVK